MDAEFAAPGIFTITRKKEWMSQSLEYNERHRHEWKHIKTEHEPAGKEVLNDPWKKTSLHPSDFDRKRWLKEEQLVNILHKR